MLHSLPEAHLNIIFVI